jgi:predicted Fe-Mo cluster-binding NifX family protein
MGWGAQESLKNRGIEVFMTDMENIDEAVKLYIQGKLVNRVERLH